jgi:hypothetical protein
MSHSHASNLIHLIFSTKGREKRIPVALQEKLWPYMAGIARKSWISSDQGWRGSGSCPRAIALATNHSVGKSGADSRVMFLQVAQRHPRRGREFFLAGRLRSIQR